MASRHVRASSTHMRISCGGIPVICSFSLAVGLKFVMATFLSLAVSESARVRHFVHVAMFRVPPFHVRNARAINVSRE